VEDLPGYRLTEGAMFNPKSAIGNQKISSPTCRHLKRGSVVLPS
jgi:hypothetical protein